MGTPFRYRSGRASGAALADAPQAVEYLPTDAVVDLAAVRRESGVDEVLDDLASELIGLRPVRTRIEEIASLLLIDRMLERHGITARRPTLHMCFTGNPGTGKTQPLEQVALRMADLLKRLGYVRRGHLVSVTRDDLVGEHVGDTAPKISGVIQRAMGGVLFIDQANCLYQAGNGRDFGGEAIEILRKTMENHRDDLVVILAGYAEKMGVFFAANPGIQSRVAHHITFPDYTVAEPGQRSA